MFRNHSYMNYSSLLLMLIGGIKSATQNKNYRKEHALAPRRHLALVSATPLLPARQYLQTPYNYCLCVLRSHCLRFARIRCFESIIQSLPGERNEDSRKTS
jgi:hypothetical protein